MVDQGYILSNKYRVMIFDELIAGETNITRIAKKHRIIPRIAEKIITDFKNHGLIEENKGYITFTEEGRKLAAILG